MCEELVKLDCPAAFSTYVMKFVEDMSHHNHMFTAEMCFSKKYELMSKMGWAPNVSFANILDIQNWRSWCIIIKDHLDAHIIPDGNDIRSSRATSTDLSAGDKGG